MIRRLLPALAFVPMIGLLAGCPGDGPSCASLGQEDAIWYLDRDRDEQGSLDPETTIMACSEQNPSIPGGDQYVLATGDCDDLRPETNTDAIELCDGFDNNCNDVVDENLAVNDFWTDADGDGFGDGDSRVTACFTPEGSANQPGDCDDTNAMVNPLATEVCNGIDDDCDLDIDDDDDPDFPGGVDLTTGLPWRPDVDMDGFGDWNEETEIFACEQPEGFVADTTDCRDMDPMVNPANAEVCNGEDDDCDQLFDDSDDSLDTATQTEWFRDADADGYGVPTESILTCTTPWFFSTRSDDCDDTDDRILSAEDTTWAADVDGDGFGAGEASEPSCTPPVAGMVSLVPGTDCDDDAVDVFPGQEEVCDAIDNDCDELVDDEDDGTDPDTMFIWYTDADGDTYGAADTAFLACAPLEDQVADNTDCFDALPEFNPGAVEICDGQDNDCDGQVDDADDNLDVDSGVLYSRDADGDGWGNLADVIRSCEAPAGYVDIFGDCDDDDPSIDLPSNWWDDVDGDGQGAGEVFAPASCDQPLEGQVPWKPDAVEDCAPDDPTQLSGSEICYDGIDQDCDGNDFTVNQECDAVLPSTCADAQLAAPMVPGGQFFRGSLEGTIDSLDVESNPSCIVGQSSSTDVMLPLRVLAGQSFRARMAISGGDSVLYLVTDCNDVQTCVLGLDESTISTSFEDLRYTNDSAEDEILYLVLDGFDASDARNYRLRIDDETPAP